MDRPDPKEYRMEKPIIHGNWMGYAKALERYLDFLLSQEKGEETGLLKKLNEHYCKCLDPTTVTSPTTYITTCVSCGNGFHENMVKQPLPIEEEPMSNVAQLHMKYAINGANSPSLPKDTTNIELLKEAHDLIIGYAQADTPNPLKTEGFLYAYDEWLSSLSSNKEE